MTERKLRRLDPQPSDLTTHKGPFVISGLAGNDKKATLVYSGFNGFIRDGLVFIAHMEEVDQTFVVDKSGRSERTQYVFAAEEAVEPRVIWLVTSASKSHYATYCSEQEAKEIAACILGTYAKFVEVL